MNPVTNAIRAAFASQEALGGETVRYADGSGCDCELIAIRGRTEAVSEDLEGARFTATTVDWLVDPAELVIDGARITPAIDHVLIDGSGRRYATAYIAGENVFRAMDNDRGVRIRIHTVEIEPSLGQP